MPISLVFTADEAKYLKAILRWQAAPDDERKRQEEERRRQQQKPAGEFRILVVGGRGTGKTALLTRLGKDIFLGEGEPPDPSYEHGCRHPITIQVETTPRITTTSLTLDEPQLKLQPESQMEPFADVEIEPQKYIIDALELPSQHLLNSHLLTQALSTTEAAVIVYSVRDEASFRLATSVADTTGARAAANLKIPGMPTLASNSYSSSGVPFLEVSSKSGRMYQRFSRCWDEIY
ncbi:hypothetical protein N0V88_000975 [Collariella sp. IMI 366227]|nr:hypothetical protein N0V88_000975 [Collariella sp. IMI 366227]